MLTATARKRKVVKRNKRKHAMPCIDEIEEEEDATLLALKELNQLAEIESEFVDFVLPWLKLVPKECTKSSKVCHRVCSRVFFFLHFGRQRKKFQVSFSLMSYLIHGLFFRNTGPQHCKL